MERVTRKLGKIAALIVVGAALAGCSKKENYADTTAAAVDTTSAMSSTMTASSTTPGMPDTTTATSTTKKSTKTSTAKKAPKKGTY